MQEDYTHLVNEIEEKMKSKHYCEDEISKIAFSLYGKLIPRPEFSLHNREIGVMEQFKSRQHVKNLLDWAKVFSPLVQFLRNDLNLPLSREKSQVDFIRFMKDKLDFFCTSIKQSSCYSIILNEQEIDTIQKICDDLKSALDSYYEGLPGSSYKALDDCMQKLAGLNITPLLKGYGNQDTLYFKMRIGNSNNQYSRNQMFHIPFEHRGWVKTNRYSIPGLPCLYLGSTPLTCWEELGRPDLIRTHTSLFLPTENLRSFDISIPPAVIADSLEEFLKLDCSDSTTKSYKDMIRTYILHYPLILCCSVRVLNPEDSFKPEYIIPQLLLQWIQQSEEYDGVAYFSTKIQNYTKNNFMLYRNFAFPVQSINATGYCDKLDKKFNQITNAVPWEIFQLHKGSKETAPGQRKSELELAPNIKTRYGETDFGRLETFLVHMLNPR